MVDNALAFSGNIQAASREISGLDERKDEASSTQQKTSKLWKMMKKLENAAALGDDAIEYSAEPIVRCILGTSASFAGEIKEAASKVSSDIRSASDAAIEEIGHLAENAAMALVSHSSNLASSMTASITSTIGRIAGKGTEYSDNLVEQSLNPPEKNGIKDL